jgi:hypothetical protein
VSHHASDPKILCVFNSGASSIANKPTFEKAVKADKRVKKFIAPSLDPDIILKFRNQKVESGPACSVSAQNTNK